MAVVLIKNLKFDNLAKTGGNGGGNNGGGGSGGNRSNGSKGGFKKTETRASGPCEVNGVKYKYSSKAEFVKGADSSPSYPPPAYFDDPKWCIGCGWCRHSASSADKCPWMNGSRQYTPKQK